ncbi:MAG: 2-polyprenyl-6-methoxyphenol hydroxylase [Betaproteobacteria bacterium]|nr:MAG: 2-polyprenyl-6-methoxyphenol hydroxylase [Betaproteobacteria bacterium]
MDTQVLVVGGGPVGLTLAIDLGRRGVRCTLIEQKEAPQFLPKMERCNARTMEIFRRMGISDKVRAAGLRDDIPMDVFIVLSLAEPPLLHLPYPSVKRARAEIRTCSDGSMPLEPYQLISQYTLEPLLKSIAEGLSSVTVRYGCQLESFTQDESGVSARVKHANGTGGAIGASYMVGCDGGGSTVRRQLGIKLRGEYNILELRQALYRCDELFERIPIGKGPGRGRHYHVADGNNSFLIMQDSTKHFTLHAVVEKDDDMKAMFERTVAIPVKYEMLTCDPWRQNLLLADRYRDGRVFLAGDAVHLVIPTGGLGMNSGVGDAIDLSWKLAATLRGWGGPALLDSYESERRQVGERNVGASRYASLGRRKWHAQYRPNIRENTSEGAATRENLVRVARVEQPKSNEMIGAELGYRYVDSPIVCVIPGGPEHLFRVYEPSTWPGARLPHVWLADGTPMQDHIPYEGYTLLRLGRTNADTSALEKALRASGAPLAVLDIPDDAPRQVYGHDLLLLRPDLHVVWRGNRPPEDPGNVAAIATGYGESDRGTQATLRFSG